MSEIYLVTGAAGHLGSTVIRKLMGQGAKIRALVLPNETAIPSGDVEVYTGDVCNKDTLSSFFAHDEGEELVVIHCAGIVSIASRYVQKVYDVNVNGTQNIVDLCVENQVRKLVYVSSVHAIPEKPNYECMTEIDYFDPDEVIGLYAKTKSEATAYVLKAAQKGLNASIVHPSGIIGPFDRGKGHLTSFVKDYYNHRLTAAIKGGYDFVDVRDVAEGIISCCEKGAAGECYILSNHYFTVEDILSMLHDITGKKAIKTYLPMWFAKMTAPLAEVYYKLRKVPPLFTSYSMYTLSSNANFSHEKATNELSYTTRDMKITLKDTVEWMIEHP